jgi:hypothetical protein
MTPLRRFRALYGAGPLHLLALLASFAIAGAAVVGWFERPRDVVNVLEWFVAAILIHDLVLLPLYSLLDRIAFGGRPQRIDRAHRTTLRRLVNPTPYLRIPAILSGLLLAVFFPVIFGLGDQTELSASGIPESGYLARWLLTTGVMFAVSGIAYAVAVSRAGAARDPGPEPTPSDPEPAPSDPEPAPSDREPAISMPEPAPQDAEPATPGPAPAPPGPELAAPDAKPAVPGRQSATPDPEPAASSDGVAPSPPSPPD